MNSYGVGVTEVYDASTASQLGLAGLSDLDLFTAAVAKGYTILSENIADFARISADHISAGCHHSGILFALSSRFTRRPGGINKLLSAICSVGNENRGINCDSVEDIVHRVLAKSE